MRPAPRLPRFLLLAVVGALLWYAIFGLAGCESVADWAAEPAAPVDPPENGGEPAPVPAGETHGDAVVGATASILGTANPFFGFGALAVGRLGLSWLARFRSK